jgi:hypothetical protein
MDENSVEVIRELDETLVLRSEISQDGVSTVNGIDGGLKFGLN